MKEEMDETQVKREQQENIRRLRPSWLTVKSNGFRVTIIYLFDLSCSAITFSI